MSSVGIKLHYILTHNNPADYLTKKKKNQMDSGLWNLGPKELRNPALWSEYINEKRPINGIPVYLGVIKISYDTYSNEPSGHIAVKTTAYRPRKRYLELV